MRRVRTRGPRVAMPAELATFDPDRWSGRPLAGTSEWPHPGGERSPSCVEVHRKGRRWRQARARWQEDEGWPGPDAVADPAADAQVDLVHEQLCGCHR